MIVCCGEALIDFIPVDAGGQGAYLPKPGGSPYNAAMTLGRLGAKVGFLGGFSSDFFGAMLRENLAGSGVDLKLSRVKPDPSTLAFVSLGGDEPQYAFFDEGSATRLFDPAETGPLPPEVQCLQVGSISLASEPNGARIERLFLEEAGRRVVSIDPNVRPSVVGDADAYRARMTRMLEAADIIKVSRVDLDWLYPGTDPEAWAQARVAERAGLVVLTAGGEGALGIGSGARVHQPAERIALVDTVGAGDAFTGGLLASLQRQGCLDRARLAALSEAELRSALAFAARVAAVTCSRAGADPPWAAEISG